MDPRNRLLNVAFGSFMLGLATLPHVACVLKVEPNLQEIYGQSAASSGPDRNPIIVVTGLLGSNLVDEETGRTVWGSFGGSYANPAKPDGARLFALPMSKRASLRKLRDDVRPHGVLDRIKFKLLGLSFERRAYTYLLSALGAGGYRDETLGRSGAIDYGDDHFTCFQFDYDWRRDTVESAERLGRFILEKKAYVEGELEKRYGLRDQEIKFDLVTHSAGSTVVRYFLRYGAADLPEDGSLPEISWEGSRSVERAVFIGPPNAGSLKMFRQLVRGRKLGPFYPTIPPAVIGTMPSVYQSLPRGRHGVLVDAADPSTRLDVLDPELWETMGWGLASPEQDEVLRWLLPDVTDPAERRAIALDHQRKCLERAEHLLRALDVPASPPEGLDLYLIAGDAKPTESVLAVDLESGDFDVFAEAPGDLSVLRSSALMDERVAGPWIPKLVSPIDWTHVIFIFREHLGLTKDPAFVDNLLYLLLESP